MTLLHRHCLVCGGEYFRDISPKQLSQGRGKYCSKQCAVIGTGNLTKCDNSGPNHYMWKGDGVGYGGLHVWVRHHLKPPEYCQECGVAPPLDLANKGIYNRDFSNWEYLCRRCHMTKDGRLEHAKATQFKKVIK